jgi:alpha-glucosidase
MLLLTLRGTPTIYQGEEIGMTDVPIPADLVQDPFEKNVPGLGFGRDPERTPMPWGPGPNAGFSTGQPWLPLGDDAESMSAQAQRDDPRSLLSLYRALARLRRRHEILTVGDYRLRLATPHVLAYERHYRDRAVLVALNLTGEALELALVGGRHETLLSTYLDAPSGTDGTVVTLRPDEGRIIRTS